MALDENLKEELLSLWSKAVKSHFVSREAFKLKCYDDAAGRAYYAMFRLLTFMNVLDGRDQGSGHKETITAFNNDYVKTGLFPIEFGRIMSNLYKVRQTADYDHFENVDKETCQRCVEDANLFLDTTRTYVEKIHPGLLPSRDVIIRSTTQQSKGKGIND
jgi:hypothetical protein